MSISSSSYFSQLHHEFQNDPYRDRFLAELEDHAEDLLEAEKIPEKSLTPHFMEKHFGDPKQVKKTFNEILRPWEKIFVFLEGLFYGIMMLFFSFIGTDLIQGFVSDEFRLNPFIFVLFVTWFFIYLFAFRRYLHFPKNSTLSLLFWMILVAGPTLIHGLLFFVDRFSHHLSIYPESALNLLNLKQWVWVMGLFFGVNGILASLAWRLQNPEEKQGVFRPPVKFTKQLRISLFIYIVAFILFRTLGSYFGFPNFNGLLWSWLSALFSPLLFLEYIFFFFFSATFGKSLFFSLYLPALLMGFLAIESILHLFQEKTWRSHRTLIILYVFSFLFISPQAFIIESDYTVPHLSLSQIVEKKEVGLLYAPMKYLNSDEGMFFHYTIGVNYTNMGDYFYLKQNTGDIFYVNPEGFEKKDYKGVILEEMPLNKNVNNDPLIGHRSEAQLICERIAGDLVFNSIEEEKRAPTEKIPLIKREGGFDRCKKLFLNDQLVSESPLNIKDWRFSSDGNWLLLHLSYGFYDPEEVHLLNLKTLNLNL